MDTIEPWHVLTEAVQRNWEEQDSPHLSIQLDQHQFNTSSRTEEHLWKILVKR